MYLILHVPFFVSYNSGDLRNRSILFLLVDSGWC